jgi:hypothetical protein
VCPSELIARVGRASMVPRREWPLSSMGQPSTQGLANIRLQLSAAGAIMTAAAAEADR